MSAPYAAGTLVRSGLHELEGYVLGSILSGQGYRIYWPSLGLAGVALHEHLEPACQAARLPVLARWHASRARQRKLVVHWRVRSSGLGGHFEPMFAHEARAWALHGNKNFPGVDHWTAPARAEDFVS